MRQVVHIRISRVVLQMTVLHYLGFITALDQVIRFLLGLLPITAGHIGMLFDDVPGPFMDFGRIVGQHIVHAHQGSVGLVFHLDERQRFAGRQLIFGHHHRDFIALVANMIGQ